MRRRRNIIPLSRGHVSRMLRLSEYLNQWRRDEARISMETEHGSMFVALLATANVGSSDGRKTITFQRCSDHRGLTYDTIHIR